MSTQITLPAPDRTILTSGYIMRIYPVNEVVEFYLLHRHDPHLSRACAFEGEPPGNVRTSHQSNPLTIPTSLIFEGVFRGDDADSGNATEASHCSANCHSFAVSRIALNESKIQIHPESLYKACWYFSIPATDVSWFLSRIRNLDWVNF